jgi:hypothetical protein
MIDFRGHHQRCIAKRTTDCLHTKAGPAHRPTTVPTAAARYAIRNTRGRDFVVGLRNTRTEEIPVTEPAGHLAAPLRCGRKNVHVENYHP